MNLPESLNFLDSTSAWNASGLSPLHSAVIKGNMPQVIQITNENVSDVDFTDRWGRSPLFHALIGNNQDIVDFLVKSNASVTIKDLHQRSLVHIAADRGLYGCLKIILHAIHKIVTAEDVEKGSLNRSFSDLWGISPFHVAAKLHSSKCLHLLLKYSFLGSIDGQDHEGLTPLHWAAAHGAEDNVQILLRYLADPSIVDRLGRLPVHWAAISHVEGSKACLQILLSSCPSQINKQDLLYSSPLHLAVEANDKEKVELLLANKRCLINVCDQQNQTPLHYACKSDLQIARWLISNGADINKRDMHGATPLHYAVLHNNYPLVAELLQQQELEDASTNEGETPLHWASRVGADASLIHLVNFGAFLTRKNRYGETPLHIAAQRSGGTSTLDVLLEFKAPVDVKTNEGCIPLHYAAQEGNSKNVKLLLKADPSSLQAVDAFGQNALHHAVIGSHLHLTQILMEIGMTPNAVTLSGKTCLHLAAMFGFGDVLHLLLENNALINAQDCEGKTPLHWACENGRSVCVDTLVEYKADVNYLDWTIERQTTLDYALKGNNVEILKSLTTAGALPSLAIKTMAACCLQRKWREYLAKLLKAGSFKALGEEEQNSGLEENPDPHLEVDGVTECCRKWTENLQDFELQDCIGTTDDDEMPTSSQADFPVLTPLLTPWFPAGADDSSYGGSSFPSNEEPLWQESDQHHFNGQSEEDRDYNPLESERRGKIVTCESIGLCVRLAEGEELEAARNAWRQRLADLTITRVSRNSKENQN